MRKVTAISIAFLTRILLFALIVVADTTAHAQETTPEPAQVAPAAAEADEPLAILAPLVGKWDEVVNLPDGRHFTAHGECKWILGRAFLKAEFTIRMSDEATLERMTLYGWDRETKQLRAWIFASSGVVREADCDWDADKKTLTMKFKPTEAGVTTTSHSHFVAPDRIEWTVESRDRDDKVVFSLKGTDRKVDSR